MHRPIIPDNSNSLMESSICIVRWVGKCPDGYSCHERSGETAAFPMVSAGYESSDPEADARPTERLPRATLPRIILAPCLEIGVPLVYGGSSQFGRDVEAA